MTGREDEIWEMRIPCQEEEIEEYLKKFPHFSSWAYEERDNKRELILYFQQKPEHHLYKIRRICGWEDRYKDFFEGVILDPFFIRPPWRKERKGYIDIVINPGTGFGTGEHPSTQGVLISLSELSHKIRGIEGIDIGTGSGILAIAAVKLGLKRVIALDKQALAIENAKENVALNKVYEQVHLIIGTPECIRGKFPLIMANLDFFTLIENIEKLAELTDSGGYLIISGFLKEDTETMLQICGKYSLKLVMEKTLKSWCSLTLIKNTP